MCKLTGGFVLVAAGALAAVSPAAGAELDPDLRARVEALIAEVRGIPDHRLERRGANPGAVGVGERRLPAGRVRAEEPAARGVLRSLPPAGDGTGAVPARVGRRLRAAACLAGRGRGGSRHGDPNRRRGLRGSQLGDRRGRLHGRFARHGGGRRDRRLDAGSGGIRPAPDHRFRRRPLRFGAGRPGRDPSRTRHAPDLGSLRRFPRSRRFSRVPRSRRRSRGRRHDRPDLRRHLGRRPRPRRGRVQQRPDRAADSRRPGRRQVLRDASRDVRGRGRRGGAGSRLRPVDRRRRRDVHDLRARRGPGLQPGDPGHSRPPGAARWRAGGRTAGGPGDPPGRAGGRRRGRPSLHVPQPGRRGDGRRQSGLGQGGPRAPSLLGRDARALRLRPRARARRRVTSPSRATTPASTSSP